MEDLRNKIEYMIEKKPEKVKEIIQKLYQRDPHMVEQIVETFEDYGHITNAHKYKELTERLKWANKQGKGERWKVDDVKKFSRMNFENEDFTEFDFAYLVNMLYAKCCQEFSDMSFYIKLAKCLLKDEDEETRMYRGAEYNHKENYKKHGMQGYYKEYDEYDEENRRGGRRYRNERMDDEYDRENYNEDNRYRNEYENRYPYDSKYRDNNIGFR